MIECDACNTHVECCAGIVHYAMDLSFTTDT
jgi:hypothetical protein